MTHKRGPLLLVRSTNQLSRAGGPLGIFGACRAMGTASAFGAASELKQLIRSPNDEQ